jgi:hypothetical protein
MSTRASHRKQTPSNSVIGTMFANGAAYANAYTASQPPKRDQNGQPLIKIWDELIPLYDNCLEGLGTYTGIADMKDRKDLFEAMSLEDRVTYISKMKQLYSDLKAYDQDLAAIRALHAGKTGGETDMTLVMQSIQITEQYENFRVQAEKVLGQSYLHLVEIIQRAEIALAAKAAENDTNLITDVMSVEVIDGEVSSS